MMRNLRMVVAGIVVCTIACFAVSTSQASTIIKLNLGGVGPDVSMTGLGVLGTVSDGVAATTGDQNTAVEYTSFLEVPFADINTATASFTLSGLLTVGPATTFGSIVLQDFFGGSFSLYDSANTLLLTGPLTSSTLTGVIGPPGTGALFTTTLGVVTGGTVAPYILPGTVSLSMNMTNVNGGAGFSVGPGGPFLNPFLADAAVNIAAEPSGVPEPTALLLVLMGSVAAIAFGRSWGR